MPIINFTGLLLDAANGHQKQKERSPVVLLVEDDQDLVMLFQRNFLKLFRDAELVCAENGVPAVKFILDQGIPDLVITDLNMPLMSGYELLSWIRADSSTKQVPVVVYSSSQDPLDIQRCCSLGATEFLLKQASTKELDNLLHRYLTSEVLIQTPSTE